MKGMSTGSDPVELAKKTAVGSEYCPGYVIVECSEPSYESLAGWWCVFWEAVSAEQTVSRN
jgi:hypothetical protein